jgi:Domain of unknown function (DUF4331)
MGDVSGARVRAPKHPPKEAAMTRIAAARTGAAVLLAASATLIAGGLASLAPGQAGASSHREAPLISGQPQYDNTDVYAFVSPDKPDTTTVVANWLPFEDPAGGPNFYKFATDARYDINIDNTGDSQPDLTYRWTFTDHYKSKNTFLYNTGAVRSLDDANLNFTQTYDLTLIKRTNGLVVSEQRLASDVPVAPSNVGKASMPDYASLRAQAVRSLDGGGHVFAGQADDSFFLDLRVFDLLYGGNLSEVGNDTLHGYNVQTVALQLPSKVVAPGQPTIGVWSDTQRRTAAGGYHQVSRLGMPLVNEVVIPLKDKDKFNASKPWNDAQFGQYVTDPELPKLIQGVYKIPAPKAPRNDLVQVFLTGVPGLNQPPNVRPAEMIRLNTSIPPSKNPQRLGVLAGDKAGYPNGRRLADDVIDISLQVVEGKLLGAKIPALGDAVNANDKAFGGTFPYVALPWSGSQVKGSGASTTAAAAGVAGNPRVTPMNGGAVTAAKDMASKPSSPALAMAGIGVGALFLGGGAGLWLMHRRRSSA